MTPKDGLPVRSEAIEAAKAPTIIVHDWNCQCSECGYGGSSWTWMCAPGREDFKPIVQESERCPGCGVKFVARVLADDARCPAPNYAGDRQAGR